MMKTHKMRNGEHGGVYFIKILKVEIFPLEKEGVKHKMSKMYMHVNRKG